MVKFNIGDIIHCNCCDDVPQLMIDCKNPHRIIRISGNGYTAISLVDDFTEFIELHHAKEHPLNQLYKIPLYQDLLEIEINDSRG